MWVIFILYWLLLNDLSNSIYLYIYILLFFLSYQKYWKGLFIISVNQCKFKFCLLTFWCMASKWNTTVWKLRAVVTGNLIDVIYLLPPSFRSLTRAWKRGVLSNDRILHALQIKMKWVNYLQLSCTRNLILHYSTLDLIFSSCVLFIFLLANGLSNIYTSCHFPCRHRLPHLLRLCRSKQAAICISIKQCWDDVLQIANFFASKL